MVVLTPWCKVMDWLVIFSLSATYGLGFRKSCIQQKRDIRKCSYFFQQSWRTPSLFHRDFLDVFYMCGCPRACLKLISGCSRFFPSLSNTAHPNCHTEFLASKHWIFFWRKIFLAFQYFEVKELLKSLFKIFSMTAQHGHITKFEFGKTASPSHSGSCASIICVCIYYVFISLFVLGIASTSLSLPSVSCLRSEVAGWDYIVLVFPYINMHLPWVYTCSPSWTPPPTSLHIPSFWVIQCTSPKLPISCIEPKGEGRDL